MERPWRSPIEIPGLVKNYLNKSLTSMPTTLEDELSCNIFLKSEDIETFSKLRDLKDNF